MSKKQKVGVGISLVSLISLIGLSIFSKPVYSQGNSEMLVVSPVNGLQIIKEAISEDGNTMEVIFRVLPAKPNDIHFNSYLSWNETANPDFESSNWYVDKNPEEYMNYLLDDQQNKITFSCLQPFGTQMIFHLSCQENPNVTASLKIDYARSQLEKAKLEITNTTLSDKKKIQVKKVLPKYSIGTVGERPSDKFTLRKEFKASSNTKYLDLFCNPTTVGLYSQEWHYQDQKYTNIDLLKAAVSQNVEQYIKSLIEFEDKAKAFSYEEFKALFTYKFPVYSYGGRLVFSSESTMLYSFLDGYEKLRNEKGGFCGIAQYDNDEPTTFFVDFSITAETITGIDFGENQDGIVFNR